MKKVAQIVFGIACAAVLTNSDAQAQQVQRPATYLIPPPNAERWNQQLYNGRYQQGYSQAGRECSGYPASANCGRPVGPVGVNVYGYSRRGVPPPYIRFNRGQQALPYAVGLGAAFVGGAMVGGYYRQSYANGGGYYNGGGLQRRPSPGRNASGCFGSDRIGSDGKCYSAHTSGSPPGYGHGGPSYGGHVGTTARYSGPDPILGLYDSACAESGNQPNMNGAVHECTPALSPDME